MDLPTAQATLDQAAAQKQQAVAQLNQAQRAGASFADPGGQAQAQAAQAKAAVDLAKVNLDHTVITRAHRWRGGGAQRGCRPDRGGQLAGATVFYLIANDLTRMQVLANIDEADVGQSPRAARSVSRWTRILRTSFRGAFRRFAWRRRRCRTW